MFQVSDGPLVANDGTGGPGEVKHLSPSTPREKMVKIGSKVVSHGRYVTFQLAEVAVPRELFRKILSLIRWSATKTRSGVCRGIRRRGKKRWEKWVWMANKMTEWLSTLGPITKIMPSDGCKGDTVPLAVARWYNFHEFGCHRGNVG